MTKPRQKGKKWEVSYRVRGYSKTFSERFDNLEEANLRCAEIDIERKRGSLRPPKKSTPVKLLTVAEFLDEYVRTYGVTHWGDSYLSANRHRIEHYINPSLGELLLRDLTTKVLDDFYQSLLTTKAVCLPGHRNTEATVGSSVIEKTHTLMHSALEKAVTWGYIPFNPDRSSTRPKIAPGKREVWSPEVAKLALELCTDSTLRLCIMLSIGCSMRIGEILGLQWEDVILNNDGTGKVQIKQTLKRCSKATLQEIEATKGSEIFLQFPSQIKRDSSTVLVLKSLKTTSSNRSVAIPSTVIRELKRYKAEQDIRKASLRGAYEDYGLVIAQDSGLPVEERLVAKAFKAFILENDLPEVVFHSLRHLSTSLKLIASQGDIKAVQGDTGHAQARMVTEVYAHTFDGNRREIADKMDDLFFSPAEAEEKSDPNQSQQILDALNKKPELVQLLTALLEKQ